MHKKPEYQFFVVQDLPTQDTWEQNHGLSTQLRQALFIRMQDEGLLASTMHSYLQPNMQNWLDETQAHKGWLICCVAKEAILPKYPLHAQDIVSIRAMAWISPLQGRLWSFDFTVFRAHFSQAVDMSQAVLSWIFQNAPCDTLMGLCTKSNRHAWRLAQKAGFSIMGHVPSACFIAKKYRYEDGVLVMAHKNALPAQSAT